MAEIALQEEHLSSGSIEDMNLSSIGSKISLKWGFVIFWDAVSAISHILILILQEFITERFLNLVKAKLLL